MNIKSLTISGYKGMENVKVDFKPLTIFVGANSAGKSSVQKLLKIFQQSIEENRETVFTGFGELKLNGSKVNAGDISTFFSHEIAKKESCIGIQLAEMIPIKKIVRQTEKKIDSVYQNFFLHNSDLFREYLASGGDVLEYVQKAMGKKRATFAKTITLLAKSKKKKNSRELDVDLLEEFVIYCNKLKNKKISEIRFKVTQWYGDNPHLSSLKVIDEKGADLFELCFSGSTYSLYNIFAERIGCKKVAENSGVVKCIFRGIVPELLDMEKEKRGVQGRLLPELIVRIIREVLESIFPDDEMVITVSPLREAPKRYYVSEAYEDLGPRFKNDTMKLLTYSWVKDEVNEWLERLDVKVDARKENSTMSVVEVFHNNSVQDLTEVGFGISQVLPILVLTVAEPRTSTVLIEQPEIHLHPKAQAELADFFIEQIERRRSFIIETHSEALLRRVRRRIAEYDKEKKLGISHLDVSICNFERDNRTGRLNVVNQPITSTGEFEWPKGFREVEKEDTFAFLKAQLAAELAQEAKVQDV